MDIKDDPRRVQEALALSGPYPPPFVSYQFVDRRQSALLAVESFVSGPSSDIMTDILPRVCPSEAGRKKMYTSC